METIFIQDDLWGMQLEIFGILLHKWSLAQSLDVQILFNPPCVPGGLFTSWPVVPGTLQFS